MLVTDLLIFQTLLRIERKLRYLLVITGLILSLKQFSTANVHVNFNLKSESRQPSWQAKQNENLKRIIAKPSKILSRGMFCTTVCVYNQLYNVHEPCRIILSLNHSCFDGILSTNLLTRFLQLLTSLCAIFSPKFTSRISLEPRYLIFPPIFLSFIYSLWKTMR